MPFRIPGINDVEFYIDNVLVGTGNRRPNTGTGFNLDEIRLGLSVRTPDSSFWFDNVSLDMVPEPTSVLLFGTGCLALAGCCRRLRCDHRGQWLIVNPRQSGAAGLRGDR
jgi:hypothetical protein